MQLQPMPVDELPAHSDWPARLLGLTAESEEWGGTGIETYERQFRELLELHRGNPDWTVHDLLRAVKRHARDDPSPVSRDGDLYMASPEAVQDLQDDALLAAVEPILGGDELHSNGAVLGLLRQAYTRERGYDRDLLSSLRAVSDIRIEAATYDVVGANPLHPLSMVRWRPAEHCR